MRIISKFHDYYDTIQSYGLDDRFIHASLQDDSDTLKSIKRNLYNQLVLDSDEINILYTRMLSLSAESYLIGFCGKIYPCIKLIKEKGQYYDDKEEITFAYNTDEIITFLKNKKLKEKLKDFENNGRWSRFSVIASDNFFKFSNLASKLEHLFVDNRIPIFVINLNTLEFIQDDQLIQYHFYKMFDAFSAFQEISMYLGGVLGLENPKMVDISNDKMRDKKGFNDISFKKVPDNRRRKQKKGKIKK